MLLLLHDRISIGYCLYLVAASNDKAEGKLLNSPAVSSFQCYGRVFHNMIDYRYVRVLHLLSLVPVDIILNVR